MSNPNFYLCDVCGEQTKFRAYVVYDRRMDAAGSMDDDVLVADLCQLCMWQVMSPFLTKSMFKPDYEAGMKFKQHLERRQREHNSRRSSSG
jgi:hypothetical protein